MRTEQDELGSALLPDHALYGLQTARALDNFALANRLLYGWSTPL